MLNDEKVYVFYECFWIVHFVIPGHFVYFKPVVDTTGNDQDALLISGDLDLPAPQCLTFTYAVSAPLLHGTHSASGTLMVYTSDFLHNKTQAAWVGSHLYPEPNKMAKPDRYISNSNMIVIASLSQI